MSNVLERYRGISEMEFYKNAIELRDEMTRFLFREKNVPKRYRAVITYPILDSFDELFKNISDANKIYTDSAEKVEQRKALQQKSIDTIDDIYMKLQFSIALIWKEIMNRAPSDKDRKRIEGALSRFAAALLKEENLLNGWKNSTHLFKPKK